MAPLGTDWERLRRAKLVDLAHPWQRGMPVSPNHPSYQMALLRRHGDMVRTDDTSGANELIVLGGHVGTHIDALCHLAHQGLIHGGIDAASVTSNAGFSELGIETVAPIWRRGVLLDIAEFKGVPVLPPGYEVTVDDLEGAEAAGGVAIEAGDAVLIRTGWAAHWNDPAVFGGQGDGAPGPGAEGGAWLAERNIFLAGGETIAFEQVPAGRGHGRLPVHKKLLVEAGIHIVEVLDLTALSAAKAREFLFVALPLKLVGATGSPVRPVAVIDG